jgi:RNA polymerase sigma factor (sigma-70 family)
MYIKARLDQGGSDTPYPGDADLVTAALVGDETAFADLMRRHQSRVWRLVCRVLGGASDGEDAVQEVFLRAYLSLDKYNRSYSFRNWILRIATNYCIDQLRRRNTHFRMCRHMATIDRQQVHSISVRHYHPVCLDSHRPERYETVLHGLLEELNPKYKIAFTLREMEDREYGEVAEALGVSQVSARVMVSRARKKIEQGFRDHLSQY